MKINCAWCNLTMRETAEEIGNQPVSHGICKSCSSKLMGELSESLDVFLNRFDFPILVVNHDAVVVAANKMARQKSGQKFAIPMKMKIGGIIECAYAAGGEDCGSPVHCRACTIRISIKHTFDTGQATIKVPAFADVIKAGEVQKISYLISTEKIDDFVALKIETVD